MKLEMSKEINVLLDEVKMVMGYDPENYIITVDKDDDAIGNHEVLDGNHRLAVLTAEGRLDEAEIYAVDYKELAKKGFWENDENQEEFEKYVVEHGKKIDNFEIALTNVEIAKVVAAEVVRLDYNYILDSINISRKDEIVDVQLIIDHFKEEVNKKDREISV